MDAVRWGGCCLNGGGYCAEGHGFYRVAGDWLVHALSLVKRKPAIMVRKGAKRPTKRKNVAAGLNNGGETRRW